MKFSRILILINIVLFIIAIGVAIKYFGPWSYAGNEVLIAGRDNPEQGEKIEVFCNYKPPENSLFKKKYKGHSHWAFITIDRNQNGSFDDDPREELVGFNKKSEVTVETYAGDDEIHVYCDEDDLIHWMVINAGDGEDKVFGGKTREWIYGGPGVDVLFGHCDENCEAQRVCLQGEEQLKSSESSVSILPQKVARRRDLIVAGSDDDEDQEWEEPFAKPRREKKPRGDKQEEIYCGDNEKCAVIGSKGRDCIHGATAGVTIVYAQDKDDYIRTYGGSDIVHGGHDDDTIVLGAGDDQGYGGKGKDKIYGGEGDDRLGGGSFADLLDGGPGNDYLCGVRGGDTLIGGEGNDHGYEYKTGKYEGIEKIGKYPCFPKAEREEEKRVMQASRLRPYQMRDWIGLPLFRVVGTRVIPRGFANARQFDKAIGELKDLLKKRNFRDVRLVISGRAVEAFVYPGMPFLYGGKEATEISLEIESPQMIEALKDHWFFDQPVVHWSWVVHEYPELETWENKWKQILNREIFAEVVLPPKKGHRENVIVVD